jgi:hypothetical protein
MENTKKNQEKNSLRGGQSCTCSCYYANSGGSSIEGNKNANYGSGYSSTSGCNAYWKVNREDYT